jgi:hypothetical protein
MANGNCRLNGFTTRIDSTRDGGVGYLDAATLD